MQGAAGQGKSDQLKSTDDDQLSAKDKDQSEEAKVGEAVVA